MDELSDIMPVLQSALGPLSGAPEPLGGGITNRNYRATLGGTEYVIRRPGKDTELLGIDREAERMATDAASRLGIAPAVAMSDTDFLVTGYVECRELEREDFEQGVEELARALLAFHESDITLPTRFWVPDLLLDYARIVTDRGGEVTPGLHDAIRVAGLIQRALPLTRPRPCHDDLLPGNIIRAGADGRLMIVDWEYAGMGDPRFDLGNLSVNNDFDEAMDERLLTAYGGGPPTDSQRAALKLMRMLSDAREGAWAAVQDRVSELDFDFDEYGHRHFERLQAAAGAPVFQEWLSTASEVQGGKGT
jgi:thiamine kinase-like enzyme